MEDVGPPSSSSAPGRIQSLLCSAVATGPSSPALVQRPSQRNGKQPTGPSPASSSDEDEDEARGTGSSSRSRSGSLDIDLGSPFNVSLPSPSTSQSSSSQPPNEEAQEMGAAVKVPRRRGQEEVVTPPPSQTQDAPAAGGSSSSSGTPSEEGSSSGGEQRRTSSWNRSLAKRFRAGSTSSLRRVWTRPSPSSPSSLDDRHVPVPDGRETRDDEEMDEIASESESLDEDGDVRITSTSHHGGESTCASPVLDPLPLDTRLSPLSPHLGPISQPFPPTNPTVDTTEPSSATSPRTEAGSEVSFVTARSAAAATTGSPSAPTPHETPNERGPFWRLPPLPSFRPMDVDPAPSSAEGNTTQSAAEGGDVELPDAPDAEPSTVPPVVGYRVAPRSRTSSLTDRLRSPPAPAPPALDPVQAERDVARNTASSGLPRRRPISLLSGRLGRPDTPGEMRSASVNTTVVNAPGTTSREESQTGARQLAPLSSLRSSRRFLDPRDFNRFGYRITEPASSSRVAGPPPTLRTSRDFAGTSNGRPLSQLFSEGGGATTRGEEGPTGATGLRRPTLSRNSTAVTPPEEPVTEWLRGLPRTGGSAAGQSSEQDSARPTAGSEGQRESGGEGEGWGRRLNPLVRLPPLSLMRHGEVTPQQQDQQQTPRTGDANAGESQDRPASERPDRAPLPRLFSSFRTSIADSQRLPSSIPPTPQTETPSSRERERERASGLTGWGSLSEEERPLLSHESARWSRLGAAGRLRRPGALDLEGRMRGPTTRANEAWRANGPSSTSRLAEEGSRYQPSRLPPPIPFSTAPPAPTRPVPRRTYEVGGPNPTSRYTPRTLNALRGGEPRPPRLPPLLSEEWTSPSLLDRSTSPSMPRWREFEERRRAAAAETASVGEGIQMFAGLARSGLGRQEAPARAGPLSGWSSEDPPRSSAAAAATAASDDSLRPEDSASSRGVEDTNPTDLPRPPRFTPHPLLLSASADGPMAAEAAERREGRPEHHPFSVESRFPSSRLNTVRSAATPPQGPMSWAERRSTGPSPASERNNLFDASPFANMPPSWTRGPQATSQRLASIRERANRINREMARTDGHPSPGPALDVGSSWWDEAPSIAAAGERMDALDERLRRRGRSDLFDDDWEDPFAPSRTFNARPRRWEPSFARANPYHGHGAEGEVVDDPRDLPWRRGLHEPHPLDGPLFGPIDPWDDFGGRGMPTHRFNRTQTGGAEAGHPARRHSGLGHNVLMGLRHARAALRTGGAFGPGAGDTRLNPGNYMRDEDIERLGYDGLLRLADRLSVQHPRGVAEEALRVLKREKFGEMAGGEGSSRDTRCGICLEDYDSDDMLMKLPCAHAMHDECLTHWLKASNTCPCCRALVT